MFAQKKKQHLSKAQAAKDAPNNSKKANMDGTVTKGVMFAEDDPDSKSLDMSVDDFNFGLDDDFQDEEEAKITVGGTEGQDMEERLKLLEQNANFNVHNIHRLRKENEFLKESNDKLKGALKQKDSKDRRREMRTQAMITQVSQRSTVKMRTLSEDIYSFLYCSKLISFPSFIAIGTVFLQYGVFSMFFANLLSTQSIPANVEIIVRLAQGIAILVTFAAQTDIRVSLRALIYQEGQEEIADFFDEFTTFRFLLANTLMFLQGFLGVVVTIFLIIYTDNVFDLLLNFTAVMFVSELDELVFYMARHGYLGRKTEKLAKDVQETEFKQTEFKGVRGNVHVYVFILLMLCGYAFFFYTANLQVNNWSLPNVIKAEFGDTIDPSLGLYSGCYQMKANDGWDPRVDYVSFQEGRAVGKFAYCYGDTRSWTYTPLSFAENGDVCEEPYLADTEERPTSFDLMDANGDQWKFQTGNPISNFQLIEVVEDEHVEAECGDPIPEDLDVCPILTISPDVEGFSGDRDWSRNWNLLELEGEPVFFYQRPLFVGEYIHPTEGLEVIFFTGRRWLMASAINLLMPSDTEASDYDASKLADPAYVYGLVEGNSNDEKFRLVNREPGAYAFITEAIDEGSDTGTPLGLRWYHTRYADNAWDTFPYSDISRPADATFTCGRCDTLANPCRFEGVCRDDGTCDCKHGATGKLCEIKPLGDGICNPFFNRGPDRFDGGDCCVESCNGVSCGVGDVSTAFEQDLLRSGNGFPYCIDPEMVPLSIVMNHTVDAQWFIGFEDAAGGDFEAYTLEVRCDRKLPIRVALDPQKTGLVTETLYVGDQAENCAISFFGIQSQSQFNAEIQLIDGMPGGDGAVMTRAANITDDFSLDIPTMYARCLKEGLTGKTDPAAYYTGSYQDQALAWLNEEIEDGTCLNTNEWLAQRYALVAMWKAENEPAGAVDRNDHCLWSRINCKDNYPVVVTHDGGTLGKLTGFIASEVGLLTKLERFDVFDNDLYGTIPSEFGLLTKMTSLAIAETPAITGTIPTTFGQLTALKDMKVWKNGLTGTVPSEIGWLGDSLGEINLQENLLTGQLPSELGKLTLLTRLTLHSNQFSGPLPAELGEMTSLTNWVMSGNAVSGSLPDFTKLSNLDTVIFFGNQLSGSLPTMGVDKLTTLWTLNLSTNNFSGSIPDEWESLSSLYWMIANFNQLTGTIPSFIGNFPYLSRVVFDNNQLVGSIPDSFANLSGLQRLRLQGNQLTGTLKPEVFSGWASMGQLYLGGNQFTGPLPSTLETFTSTLDYFDCYNNMLDGPIPEELYQATNLWGLYMMNNMFTGTISDSIGSLSNLWYLDLSGNSLSGTIPTNLGLLTNLIYVNLLGPNTNYTGTVPAELCSVMIANNATSDLWDACTNGTPL